MSKPAIREQGTKFAIPVVYYSGLISTAYGGSAKLAGLDGHVIQSTKLRDIAGKQGIHDGVFMGL